jgi:phosphohistidine phosphatase SixA
MVMAGNQAAALSWDRPSLDAQYDAEQSQQVLTGLAGHIKAFWHKAERAKRVVEQQMIEAMLARRGEYTPQKKAQIAEQRQPAIYMMVAATKMRQVESLLRDVLLGTGAEKPWTLVPTPEPEMPPAVVAAAVQQLQQEIQQAMLTGFMPTIQAAQERLREIRDELRPMLMEQARRHTERMESRMEDQLVEGGLPKALDQLITDIATFKTAFLAGPLVRNKPQLSWGPGGELKVETRNVLEWERVDPFDMYPAPWANDIERDDLIRRWRLTRGALNEMIGVEGFSEAAIRKVIEQYDVTGYHDWLSIDSVRADAEGKDQADQHATGLIDALQYWGSASGQMLLDWGIDPALIDDPHKEYQIEAWLIGPHVIKAVLNADPLARRPYYAVSFQPVPGSVWGNAPYDLCRDQQDMCNAAARALAANMGIASGPQVVMLANRVAKGEDVTEMFPWKIWQFESDPMGSTAKPVEFFQPGSNANELMGVFERFSQLADEAVGIPRYMAGFNGGEGGAGRTASGISMMIGNASKVIKQLLGHIDTFVITPMLERLYYYNMRYSDDPDLKGDVKVVARGALSLQTKEAAQMRINEFLAATGNPVDMQIVGLEGRAELLRSAAKMLNVNPDKVVPPEPVLRMRQAMQAQQMQQMQQPQSGGTPAKPGQSREQLMDGTPTTDTFSPRKVQ